LKISKAGVYWVVFDWARGPFYYVVIVSIFSVYFAETIVEDNSRGQVLFGIAVAIAGLGMALIAPFLGGFIDRGGAKKPALAFLMTCLAFASSSLYFVSPENQFAIPLAMTLLVVAGCAFSMSELFHNALLPVVGERDEISSVSGLGFSLGGLASVIMLLTLIYLMEHPPLGLVPSDIARSSGLFCGIWMLVFLIPFHLGMPDYFRANQKWRGARFFPETWKPIQATRKLFKEQREIMNFLVARMVFVDGLTAFAAIGAVYVAGVLGWSSTETAIMGIVATASAVLGGILAGFLDSKLGPKKAIIWELVTFTAFFIFQLGITTQGVMFGLVELEAVEGSRALFPKVVDLVYLATIIPQSAIVIATYSSCRSLLVALSPPDKVGYFFGIYAMTSTITVWIGPSLVAIVTLLTNDQRLGFGSLIFLLITGCFLMTRIKEVRI